MSPAYCLVPPTFGALTRGVNDSPDFVEHEIRQYGLIASDLLGPVKRAIRGCKDFRIGDQAMSLQCGHRRANTDGNEDRRLIRDDRAIVHGGTNPLRAVFYLFPRATGQHDHELL